MNCQICGKPATVHVCQIVGGREVEAHYCPQHSASSSVAKCQICGKPATLHESEVLGGQKAERHYFLEHFEDAGLSPDQVTDGPFRNALEALEKLNKVSAQPHKYPRAFEDPMPERRNSAVKMPKF